MVSVTGRIKEVKQPRGGYIHPKLFTKTILNDNNELYAENIHASTTGLVVDYMSRFMSGAHAEEAFKISLLGASLSNMNELADNLLSNIKGLDDQSIINACKLVAFDAVYRAGLAPPNVKLLTPPDAATIQNIRTMVERTLTFFDQYGPVTADGIEFPGGYSEIVTTGDGDFLTEDTLWDMKVIKGEITSKHTLQLVMYFLMAKKSNLDIYQMLTKIGVFNPRLNAVYTFDMRTVDPSIIDEIEKNVLGY